MRGSMKTRNWFASVLLSGVLAFSLCPISAYAAEASDGPDRDNASHLEQTPQSEVLAEGSEEESASTENTPSEPSAETSETTSEGDDAAANGSETDATIASDPQANATDTEVAPLSTEPHEENALPANTAARATTSVIYVDENGTEHTCPNAELISDIKVNTELYRKELVLGADNTETWYTVSGYNMPGTVTIKGTVNHILQDDSTLQADSSYFNMDNNSGAHLIVWGQSQGTGKILSYPPGFNQPSIAVPTGTSLTVNSGTVDVRGGYEAAGIGSSRTTAATGTVMINGGTVTAKAGAPARGAVSGDDVYLNSGLITAEGSGCPGIAACVNSEGIYADNNAVIFASGSPDIKGYAEQFHWKGVIFENGNGRVYGTVTPTVDFEIPESRTIDFLAKDPTREGFVLAGWRAPDGSAWDLESDVVTGPMTITAAWNPRSTPVEPIEGDSVRYLVQHYQQEAGNAGEWTLVEEEAPVGTIGDTVQAPPPSRRSDARRSQARRWRRPSARAGESARRCCWRPRTRDRV